MTDCPLTTRQLEVLRLTADGKSTKEVGLALGCEATTVRSHISDACRKLNAPSGHAAALECVRRGWISVEGLGTADFPPDWELLTRIEEHLARMVEVVERDRRLTPEIRAFIAAVDDHLAVRHTDGARMLATRERMHDLAERLLPERFAA